MEAALLGPLIWVFFLFDEGAPPLYAAKMEVEGSGSREKTDNGTDEVFTDEKSKSWHWP